MIISWKEKGLTITCIRVSLSDIRCRFIDEEGVQTMHILGRNMAWLLKCIEAGKKAGVEMPSPVEKIKTNYIR